MWTARILPSRSYWDQPLQDQSLDFFDQLFLFLEIWFQYCSYVISLYYSNRIIRIDSHFVFLLLMNLIVRIQNGGLDSIVNINRDVDILPNKPFFLTAEVFKVQFILRRTRKWYYIRHNTCFLHQF